MNGVKFRSNSLIRGSGSIRWSSGVGVSLVGWCRVGFVGGSGFVFGVLGLAGIFHISNVAVAVSLVGDGLSAAIGEDHVVGAGSFSVAIALFRVAHVNVSVAVLDVIGEAVRLSSLKFIWKVN